MKNKKAQRASVGADAVRMSVRYQSVLSSLILLVCSRFRLWSEA